MTEWIKCADRLPSPCERIGYTYDGHLIMRNQAYDHEIKQWVEEAKYFDRSVETPVLYWMPWPEVPK